MKRSPTQIAGLAFLITILAAVFTIAIATLLPPETFPAGSGAFIETISSSACPASLIIAALAYFWAKSQQ